MAKALVLIELPDKKGDKVLEYDAKTLFRHPQCCDKNGDLCPLVGIKYVGLMTDDVYKKSGHMDDFTFYSEAGKL